MIAISQTPTGALSNLTRLNQTVLDGRVGAVTDSGPLLVHVGPAGSLYASALVDTRFRAGERVRMVRADDSTWQVIGLATQGGQARTTALPVDDPAAAVASDSLQAALQRFAAASNQGLKSGRDTAVLSDGTLEVQLKAGAFRARAATNHRFKAGARIYAFKADNGGYLVMGAIGR